MEREKRSTRNVNPVYTYPQITITGSRVSRRATPRSTPSTRVNLRSSTKPRHPPVETPESSTRDASPVPTPSHRPESLRSGSSRSSCSVPAEVDKKETNSAGRRSTKKNRRSKRGKRKASKALNGNHEPIGKRMKPMPASENSSNGMPNLDPTPLENGHADGSMVDDSTGGDIPLQQTSSNQLPSEEQPNVEAEATQVTQTLPTPPSSIETPKPSPEKDEKKAQRDSLSSSDSSSCTLIDLTQDDLPASVKAKVKYQPSNISDKGKPEPEAPPSAEVGMRSRGTVVDVPPAIPSTSTNARNGGGNLNLEIEPQFSSSDEEESEQRHPRVLVMPQLIAHYERLESLDKKKKKKSCINTVD